VNDTDANFSFDFTGRQCLANDSAWQDDSLVGWFNFDVNNTNVANHADYTINLTTVNSNPIYHNNCPNGGCYYFDGVDDKIEGVDSDAYILNDSFTISFWVYINESNVTSSTIFSKHDSFGFEDYGVTLLTGGMVRFWYALNTTTSNSSTSSNVLVNVSQWTYITVTGSNITKRIEWYKNGTFVENKSISGNWYISSNTTRVPAIGCLPTTTTWCINGSIDNIKLHKRVLSAQEISEEYNRTVGNYNPTLYQAQTEVGESYNATVICSDGDTFARCTKKVTISTPPQEIYTAVVKIINKILSWWWS
jgi:hypothetical protein